MMKPGYKKASVVEPAFAGQFYPAGHEELHNLLRQLFQDASEPVGGGKIRAVIAPHAGYVFSGQVAASAYNQIPEGASYERVFILASSHNASFKGAAVCKSSTFSTPLGFVNLDTEAAGQLVKRDNVFHYRTDTFLREHSLEVQIPFLQYKLGSRFQMVPVILGNCSVADCSRIAQILEPWFTPENLFVVSTDFSHYPSYDDAVVNDLETAMAVCCNDPEVLLQYLDHPPDFDNLVTSLCGWTSVTSLLFLTTNKPLKYKPVQYKNSGDAKPAGEKDRVVGYWALAVYDYQPSVIVTLEEQAQLLDSARKAVMQFLSTGDKMNIESDNFQGNVKQQTGLFVSIYVDGELRGCMGNMNTDESLNQLVKEIAVSAACDSRFKNLTLQDLDSMAIEISVLSPLRKIHSPEEFIPGQHGIYIQKGSNTGTYLPKVAIHTGWSREELLGHCSQDKAQIGWDGWKTADLFVYEAFVFKG
jgi:MEMO1 family protein